MYYREYARNRSADPRIRFDVGNALELPYPDATFNQCLALLVINLIAQPENAVKEMCRVTRPGGSVAVCHWDASGGMEMNSTFWEEATKLDPAAEPVEKHTGHTVAKGSSKLCGRQPV
jgi:ubiquinone/menaquinone biosynthesis C-methylase UbiE